MKSLTTTVIVVLSITAAIKTDSAVKFPGCIQVSKQETCTECFKRQVKTDGEGCGPVLPETDNCLIYSYNQQFKKQECAICKPGYGNSIKTSNGVFSETCVKGTIPDCLVEVDIEGRGRVCAACSNGKYSVFSTILKTSKCQAIQEPVLHCKWGSVYQKGAASKARCFRCDEGYAINVTNGKCQDPVQVGCWSQLEKFCYNCNPFEGYSTDSFGNCFKSASERALSGGDLRGVVEGRRALVKSALAALGARGDGSGLDFD